jgi:broad specificity phosphatase PhoE
VAPLGLRHGEEYRDAPLSANGKEQAARLASVRPRRPPGTGARRAGGTPAGPPDVA